MNLKNDFIENKKWVQQHSVLEKIWIKGSYLDQRLSQHENLYPIGLKSATIEMPHGGSHNIDFPKTYFTNKKTALQ